MEVPGIVKRNVDVVRRFDFEQARQRLGHALGRYSLLALETLDRQPVKRLTTRHGNDEVKLGDEPMSLTDALKKKAAYCPSQEATPAEDARYIRKILFAGGALLGPRDYFMLYLDNRTNED